jgi:F-type H+-transporting ATPase subunit b
MIHLDYSIVYQIVLFVVLWLILNKLLFQPYLRLLEEREHQTTGAQHDSVDLENEGAKLKAQFDEKMAQGQADGYAAKEAINQDARQQREKILGQARDEAARSLEQIRLEITAAMEQEKRLAATEVSAVAADMVNKVLGRKVG